MCWCGVLEIQWRTAIHTTLNCLEEGNRKYCHFGMTSNGNSPRKGISLNSCCRSNFVNSIVKQSGRGNILCLTPINRLIIIQASHKLADRPGLSWREIQLTRWPYEYSLKAKLDIAHSLLIEPSYGNTWRDVIKLHLSLSPAIANKVEPGKKMIACIFW